MLSSFQSNTPLNLSVNRGITHWGDPSSSGDGNWNLGASNSIDLVIPFDLKPQRGVKYRMVTIVNVNVFFQDEYLIF
jgi:hypothetical protein